MFCTQSQLWTCKGLGSGLSFLEHPFSVMTFQNWKNVLPFGNMKAVIITEVLYLSTMVHLSQQPTASQLDNPFKAEQQHSRDMLVEITSII